MKNNITVTLQQGVEQGAKQWGRQHTYGGKLVENIVHAKGLPLRAEAFDTLYYKK